MNRTIKTVVFWIVIGISALLLWQVVKSSPAQQGIPETTWQESQLRESKSKVYTALGEGFG